MKSSKSSLVLSSIDRQCGVDVNLKHVFLPLLQFINSCLLDTENEYSR